MTGPSGPTADVLGVPVTDLQYSISRTYNGVIPVLFALSTLFVLMRLLSRWKTSLGADDYLVVSAAVGEGRLLSASFKNVLTRQMFGLVDMAVIIKAISSMLGPRPEYQPLSYVNHVTPLSVVAEITSTWSVALLKTSIAVMLRRFQRTRGWAVFLYSVIGVQIATAVFVTIMQSTRCIPIQTLWDPTVTEKRCWGDQAFKISMTVAAVLVIITDVIYATIPLTFLHHVRRSVRDRIQIGFLMSLGLFASAASIVKAVIVQQVDGTTDYAGHGLSIALWASIEAQVGIIAACIPCLRAPFLRLLGHLGISTGPSGDTRSVPVQGGIEHHGSRTLTKYAPSESEEDILVPEQSQWSTGRGRIDVKPDIDIEMASVVATSR